MTIDIKYNKWNNSINIKLKCTINEINVMQSNVNKVYVIYNEYRYYNFESDMRCRFRCDIYVYYRL